MRSTPTKSLTIKCSYRYLSQMETIVLLCLAIVVGHVVSIIAIMSGMKKISEEVRQIVLERENTSRILYSVDPYGKDEAGSDTSHAA